MRTFLTSLFESGTWNEPAMFLRVTLRADLFSIDRKILLRSPFTTSTREPLQHLHTKIRTRKRTAKRVVLREGSDSQDHQFTSFALNRSCSVITPQFSVRSLGDASRATRDYAQATTFCMRAAEPRIRPRKLNKRILNQTREFCEERRDGGARRVYLPRPLAKSGLARGRRVEDALSA